MKDYDKLSENARKLFDRVYARHLAAMGAEMRKNYTRENIKKIKVNSREQCLEVYFRNGEWFKYFTNGTWG